MPSAFLAYTPYHVLLAEALSRQLGREPTLLLADESGLVRRIPAIAAQGPFARVVHLATIRTEAGGRALGPVRAAVYRRNIARIRRAASERPWGHVFVPNPVRPESRAAAALAGGHASYVEDGVEAYVRSRPWTRFTRLARTASALVAGVRPPPETDFVLSMPFDDGYALMPTCLHVSPGSTPPRILPIERDALRTSLARWVEASGIDATTPFGALVLLDHGAPASRVRELVARAARGAECTVAEVTLKPHPLDGDAERRLRPLGADVTDRFLPSELLLARVRERGWVLGGASSALLTTAFLRPDVRIELDETPRKADLTALLRAFGADAG